jgi:hypothetical protein
MATLDTKNPRWWGEPQTSAWDRVKEAMSRDWEQTKADFTGGKSGHDLDQDAGDTFAQALGNQRTPPAGTPNPLDANDVKHAAHAQEKVALKLDARTERGAKKIARNLDWGEAQHPVRFGFGAASHYADNWDSAFDGKLRLDWEETQPTQSWDDARELARHGWDHARLKT